MFKIITSKQQKFSQSDPVLIHQISKNCSPIQSWCGQKWLQSWPSPIQSRSVLISDPYARGTNSFFINQPLRWRYKQFLSKATPTLLVQTVAFESHPYAGGTSSAQRVAYQWCTDMEILQSDSIRNFFIQLHIQSTSENLNLLTPISNPNRKPPTKLHISQNMFGSVYFAVSQTQLVEVVTWQAWYAQEDKA